MNERAPVHDIERVRDAQQRFLDAISGLDDESVRRPSLLPDWTVGHVIAHVARNADSHVRRSEAAAHGETVEQYPGGYAGRTAEIEASAGRSAVGLAEDLRTSAARLDDVWTSLPDAAWAVLTIDVSGTRRPLALLPSRRWQELEVHAIDLDVGITHRDWPHDFVAAALPRIRQSLAARLAEGARAPEPGSIDERDELAW
jgi:maleylpyruvate isomerase